MTDLPSRDLRNDVSAVLRRVERGERLRVTVSGRPVAELVPIPRRPQSLPWQEFLAAVTARPADAAVAGDLRAALPETTDDLDT